MKTLFVPFFFLFNELLRSILVNDWLTINDSAIEMAPPESTQLTANMKENISIS